MTEFVQFTVTGISLGAVYALLSLGWVVVERVSGQLFFLQGSFVVLGAFGAAVLIDTSGLRWWLAIPLVLLGCAGLMVAIDAVVIRRVRNQTPFTELVVLLGLAFLADQLIPIVFGTDDRTLEPLLSTEPLSFLGASIQPQQVLLIVTTAVLVGALALLARTRYGMAMRASAENTVGAGLVGISARGVRTGGFVLAAALGATAGILLAPLGPIAPTAGLLFALKGFIAATLGRWTVTGAVAAGLLLGLAEAYGAGYVSSVYKDVISLGALVAALLLGELVALLTGRMPRNALPVRLRGRSGGAAAETS